MDVVLRLRELRRLRGLSQKEAGDLAGLGEKSISSFETGERIASMKLSQLERLLHAYGVTLKEFFSESLDRRLAPWDVPKDEDELDALVSSLRALPRKSRSSLLARFRMMAESSTDMPSMSRPAMHSRAAAERDWQMLNSRN
ncbi:MAG TPA: helix-turn-helix domain-containing protein [Thermoanaerobaculia bacterium]|nr:helix-turn-helix domain-containing protein [Thermoanaerobaculia bacterium]